MLASCLNIPVLFVARTIIRRSRWITGRED
jgi:hypothetical protein